MPCRSRPIRSHISPWRTIDVLCVGDAATDVFIRLADAHVRTWEDDHGRWMDLPFGGKVPFEYALTVEAGGNAANAAVGLARLGLSTALAAHVGDDQIGRDMEAALQREGSTRIWCISTRGAQQPKLRAVVRPGPHHPGAPRALRLPLAPPAARVRSPAGST